MAAQVKIQLTPHVGLSPRFSDEFASQVNAGGFDSAALLLPTSRAVELARRSLLADGRLPGLFDPRLLTFPRMAQSLLTASHHASRQVTDVQRELLVQDVLDDLQGESVVADLHARADRPGVVRAVVGLLDELKRATVSSAEFEQGAYDALPAHLAHGAVAKIYTAYQARLQERKLYDQPGLFWEALAALQAGQIQPYESLQLLLVDGFEDFTTSQVLMLQEFAKRLERLEIRVLLDREREAMFPRSRATVEQLQKTFASQPTPEDAAQDTGADNLRRLRRHLFGSVPAEIETVDGTVRVLEVAGGIMGECREVARHLKLLLCEPDAPPPHQVAIVLRSWESGHDVALRELLPRYGVPAEFSRGSRLADVPVVLAALAVLDVPVSWRREDVVKLLNNSYVDHTVILPEGLKPWQVEEVALEAGIVGGAWEDWGKGFDRLAQRLTDEGAARLEREREMGLTTGDPALSRSLDDDEGQRLRPLDVIERERRSLERCREALDGLREMLRPLERAASLQQAAAEYGNLLAKLSLPALAKPVGGNDRQGASRDLQALEMLSDLLREVGEAPGVLGLSATPEASSPTDFAQIIRGACASQRLPGARGTQGGVRVLDVSEVRHESFHTVFLCGLRDGLFPLVGRQDPFYSDADRAAMQTAMPGLRPRVTGRFQDASLLYAALSAATGQVWLTYPLTEADGSPVLRSPYVVEVLQHWREEGEGDAPAGLIQTRRQSQVLAALSEVCRRAEALETLAAKQAIPPLQRVVADELRARLNGDGLKPNGAWLEPLARVERLRRDADYDPDAFGGILPAPVAEQLSVDFDAERTFSPSALNLFASCPMRFFFQRVLGLDAVSELSEALDRRELGNLGHRVLASFFGQRLLGMDECDPITSDNLEAAKTALRRTIGEVCRPEVPPVGCDARVWVQSVTRLTENLEALLDNEALQNERPEPQRGGAWSPPRRTLAVEASYGRDGSFAVDTPAGPVKVAGRIDRIDLAVYNDTPYFVLIDYKTTRGIGKGLVLAGADLQLPLYAMAARHLEEGHADAVFMWGCSRLERPVGWVGMMRRKLAPGEFGGDGGPDALDVAEETACRMIGEYVTAIRAGRFPAQPNDLLNPCRNCDFAGICRK